MSNKKNKYLLIEKEKQEFRDKLEEILNLKEGVQLIILAVLSTFFNGQK